MKKTTLVIMAAGIGSRFRGGIKQLAPVGPNQEVIMEYSIYDAIEAGFNKVVFVIKKDIESEFRAAIGNRIEKQAEVAYVYQELSDIPDRFQGKFQSRTKPWGTGQAILCCRDVVKEPFLVINADDYYGKEAYREAFHYLNQKQVPVASTEQMDIGMVGFVLGNTLSDNGTVTRGVCRVGENHMLEAIRETYGIEKRGEQVYAERNGEEITLNLDAVVSMNMWALRPEFFEILEKGFSEFLERISPEEPKAEYLLPAIIGDLLLNGRAQVKVLRSKDKWFGVTYKEDKETVVQCIRELVEKGEYPEKLFENMAVNG